MEAIEAMLAKKPVVAANHGGLTETVLLGHNGLLFEPNYAKFMSEALEILIRHAAKRKEFEENSYHRTFDNFSLSKHLEKFEKIFEKI